jgi:hypothetical protein
MSISLTRHALLSAVGLALLSTAVHAGVNTAFTFETNPPADLNNSMAITGILADTGSGTASASHASAATDYSTPAGNGSANALSSNTWAVGDYYQFVTDLTGVTGAQLQFDQVSSGTGPGTFKVQTSTDGSTFTDLPSGAYTVSTSVGFATGSEKTDNPPRYLFDISALDGISTAYVRLTSTVTSAAAGTSRVDNVLFGTDLPGPVAPVPEPASLGVLALGGLLLLRRKN